MGKLQANGDEAPDDLEPDEESDDEFAGLMKDLLNPEADLPTQGAGDAATSDASGLGLSAAQREGIKKLGEKKRAAKAAKYKDKKEQDKKKGALITTLIGGKLKTGIKIGPAKSSDQAAEGEDANA